jgi:hypothetical protein
MAVTAKQSEACKFTMQFSEIVLHFAVADLRTAGAPVCPAI